VTTHTSLTTNKIDLEERDHLETSRREVEQATFIKLDFTRFKEAF
jgi:hypothetical protein